MKRNNKKYTHVDKLVQTLESALAFSLNHWKLSTDMDVDSAAISQVDFDDSHWRTFDLMEKDVFPQGCWLRKVITIPEVIGGKNVSGELNLFISINDIAELWIDGKFKDSWQWDKSVEIIKDAKPGKKIVVLIKAFSNHPMYLFWLSDAYLILNKAEPVKKIVENIKLSFRTAQKLLSEDTYLESGSLTIDAGIDKTNVNKHEKKQLYKQLQKLAAEVDTDSLSDGKYEEFLVSANSIKKRLKPFKEFAQQFTLSFAANAHLDAEWLWREKETIEASKRTFESTLKLMEQKNDLTYIQSSAAYYEWMEKYHPEIFEQIRKKVKDGNWEIVGGMWIEPDGNLPDGESWSKQFLYAQKYFKERFGKRAHIGFNPDTFGYNWNLPQFLNNAGIDTFVTTKINWNDTNPFPHKMFWWQSPDGSNVLTYIPYDYMDKIDNPFQFIDRMRQFEANTGLKKILLLFGIGDHGGGPSLQMLKRIEALEEIWVFPKIEFTTFENYFNSFSENELLQLPVWKDELYLEFHRGTYTSQAKIKKLNRKTETLLNNAEKLSLLGNIFKPEILEKAWKHTLYNQFHDILPGTCIPSVAKDAYKKYNKALQLGEFILSESQQAISRRINTAALPEGEPVILFNCLSWERENIVSFDLPQGDESDYIVLNELGDEVISQIISIDEVDRKIIFKANVPAMGYAVYGLKKRSPESYTGKLKAENHILENAFFKIEIDKVSGSIKQIFDKRNNRNVLNGKGNRLQMFGNKVPLWKAWNINYTGEEFAPRFIGGEFIERGSLCCIYRAKYDFLKPGVRKPYPTEDFPSSFFTQDIILYDDMDVIEFRTEVDWWEDEVILKTTFPLNIKGFNAAYEIPYGVIHRSSDLSKQENKGKFEVPALRWADLSEDEYGVSLINDSKYGYDVDKNVMRLTLLNAPLWPDPMANRGQNSVSYQLYPHNGDWKKAQTKRRGYEFNNPVLCFPADRHIGELPLRNSFVQISPDNIILTTIKYAEDNKDVWVLQWYESEGKDTEVELILPAMPKRIVGSNFLEEDGNDIKIKQNKIRVKNLAYAVMTVKVYF